jgi:hypothetical protein
MFGYSIWGVHAPSTRLKLEVAWPSQLDLTLLTRSYETKADMTQSTDQTQPSLI